MTGGFIVEWTTQSMMVRMLLMLPELFIVFYVWKHQHYNSNILSLSFSGRSLVVDMWDTSLRGLSGRLLSIRQYSYSEHCLSFFYKLYGLNTGGSEHLFPSLIKPYFSSSDMWAEGPTAYADQLIQTVHFIIIHLFHLHFPRRAQCKTAVCWRLRRASVDAQRCPW